MSFQVVLIVLNLIYAYPTCSQQDKSNLSEEHLPGLEEIVGDENIAKAVLKGARSSMGESCLGQQLIAHCFTLFFLDLYSHFHSYYIDVDQLVSR